MFKFNFKNTIFVPDKILGLTQAAVAAKSCDYIYVLPYRTNILVRYYVYFINLQAHCMFSYQISPEGSLWKPPQTNPLTKNLYFCMNTNFRSLIKRVRTSFKERKSYLFINNNISEMKKKILSLYQRFNLLLNILQYVLFYYFTEFHLKFKAPKFFLNIIKV